MLVSTRPWHLRSVAVRAPGFGHRRIAELQDVAAFTNGRVVTQDGRVDMENVLRRPPRSSPPGGCHPRQHHHHSTRRQSGNHRQPARPLRTELARATNPRDQDKLSERLASLAGRWR